MSYTETFRCLECDHEHTVDMLCDEQGWYPAVIIDECDACGAAIDDDDTPSDVSARATERRQMGITG